MCLIVGLGDCVTGVGVGVYVCVLCVVCVCCVRVFIWRRGQWRECVFGCVLLGQGVDCMDIT